jgi:hypothetical protein
MSHKTFYYLYQRWEIFMDSIYLDWYLKCNFTNKTFKTRFINSALITFPLWNLLFTKVLSGLHLILRKDEMCLIIFSGRTSNTVCHHCFFRRSLLGWVWLLERLSCCIASFFFSLLSSRFFAIIIIVALTDSSFQMCFEKEQLSLFFNKGKKERKREREK